MSELIIKYTNTSDLGHIHQKINTKDCVIHQYAVSTI